MLSCCAFFSFHLSLSFNDPSRGEFSTDVVDRMYFFFISFFLSFFLVRIQFYIFLFLHIHFVLCRNALSVNQWMYKSWKIDIPSGILSKVAFGTFSLFCFVILIHWRCCCWFGCCVSVWVFFSARWIVFGYVWVHEQTAHWTWLYRRENWNWLRNWHSIALRKWFSFTFFFFLFFSFFLHSLGC